MAGLPKVVRDPVHNLITLAGDEGQLVLDLMDRPEFQRLRRIRQLGLALLTFPGAEHSRWAHSFGVCHVARRMLDALRSQYGETSAECKELSELRREIVAAALLHDVGHGSFSHVFERAIPPPDEPPEDYPKDHEVWSQRIIRERFGSTLEGHGVRTEVVAGLIDKTNREHLLAKDFISSQLDAELHYRGFGVPGEISDILTCAPWQATLIFEPELPPQERCLPRLTFRSPHVFDAPTTASRANS